MALGLERNSPGRRRRSCTRRSRSTSPSSPRASPRSSPGAVSKGCDDTAGVTMRPPQAYMKQVKLHPSGCQQWSSQIVAGGGHYMAYASTLTTYVYDTRDFSLVTILGGNECNVHSVLWHPGESHRLLVFSNNGRGVEWDVRSEERIVEHNIGLPIACTAWDPSDQANLAVISKGWNCAYLLRNDSSGKAWFVKDYSRRSEDHSLAATCVKWSRHERGTLAVGWSDGRISFSKISASERKGKTKLVLPQETAGAVVDIRYDPNAGPYILIAYRCGSVVLWDAAEHYSIATFDRCAVSLTGVRWMAWAPGKFLALSSKTAVARMFNVSQGQPIGSIRLGETGSGVRDVAWLNPQPTDDSAIGTESIGPRAICGFNDGSLSVVNAAFGERYGRTGGTNSEEAGMGPIPWSSKAGHIETVFACAHKPGDQDTFATGSYGSSIKIWHLPTMDLKMTLTGQAGAIYSVDWSEDGERIASASGEGTVWIWDTESGKAQTRLRHHTRAAHRVQWDPFHATRLASAGADRSLAIFSHEGAVDRVYIHPAALFGCHWCPGYADVIATGCQDGNVRVFDVSCRPDSNPQYILSGHTRRVFHVSWSPLLDGTLASGSDDGTVMVWSIGAGKLPRSSPPGYGRLITASAVLKGHTSNVRPLHWNTEVPWLLLSGSWDGTVRAWDVRRAWIGRDGTSSQSVQKATRSESITPPGGDRNDGACIAIMSDHVADVYGISGASSCPFSFVSVSRDTTLRQFSLEGVVSSIKTRAITRATLAGGLGDTRDAMLPDSPTVLCGEASRSLEDQLRGLRQNRRNLSVTTCRAIFNFFGGPDGICSFWDTLSWAQNHASANSTGTLSPHKRSSGAQLLLLSGKKETAIGEEEHATNKNHAGMAYALRQVSRELMEIEGRVLHRDARLASSQALAKRLASSPVFIVQDRRMSRADCVERASRLHFSAGDLRSSCEALISVGKWERAMALAPGVDSEYWRDISGRYAQVLLTGRGDEASEEFGGTTAACVTNRGENSAAMAAAILASIGRPSEAIDALKGTVEALILAVAVADGAYPPPELPCKPSSAQCPSDTRAAAVPGDTRKESDTCRLRGADEEEKLLDLLDDHVTEGCRRGSRFPNDKVKGNFHDRKDSTSNVHGQEEKAAPRHDTRDGWRNSRDEGSNDSGARTSALRRDRARGECKRSADGVPSSPHRSSSQDRRGESPDRQARRAAQRAYGEAALRSITEDRAKDFFKASQPVLAAAAILSVCDGSRPTAVPALSLLLRGEEPELAYAAAQALRFPARELRPFVRAMATRAEGWGDTSLAAELLLDAGKNEDEDDDEDDDDDATFERRTPQQTKAGYSIINSATAGHKSNGSSEGIISGSRGDCSCGEPTIERGHRLTNGYGTGGQEAGLRGAALISCRGVGNGGATDTKHDICPQKDLGVRSKTSYLEDATEAAPAARDDADHINVVQLFILGDNFERAVDVGTKFLRDKLSACSHPSRRSLKAALAVIRALSCGTGQPLLVSLNPPRLRMAVLAYASYVGALEATSRGYDPVVAPLLRTASLCVQAAERLPLPSAHRGSRGARADQKTSEEDATNGRSSSPGLHVGHERDISSPRSCHVFPSCMSPGALASATATHFSNRAKDQSYHDPHSERRTVQGVQDGEDSCIQDAKAGPTENPTSTINNIRTSDRESKGEEASDSADHGDICDGPGSTTFAKCQTRLGAGLLTGASSTTGRVEQPHPWYGAKGEIIVSGSRLPSCRRHERVAWRTATETTEQHRRESTVGKHTLTTISADGRQEAWPFSCKGAMFLLEDGKTTMGFNDAVMWAKVNPFSPLNTGSRIMPF